MPKIVFVMNLDTELVKQVQAAAHGWEVIVGKDPSVWLPHLKDAEIVGGWNSHVMEQCFARDSALRWLHNWGAGVNQIPFDLFQRKNVILTNSSGVHANPISEVVIGLMLALTRRLHINIHNQRDRKWHHANVSLEMHGKTVGILGVGAIGSETAKLCKAFGMRVLGLRRSSGSNEYVDVMYRMDQLNDLLADCDYVVNTLPLTRETQYMMGREQFDLMKPTAFYINIGRGETTDETALIEALSEGRIAGAGLDVFVEEPLPNTSPLWDMETVIVTPHTSGSTEHYDARVMDIFLPNLRAYLNGEELPLNRVNLELQY